MRPRRRHSWVLSLPLVACLLFLSLDPTQAQAPSAPLNPNSTATSTPRATKTPTRQSSPTATATPRASASPTATPTASPSPTATLAASPGSTATPAASPTVTPTAAPLQTAAEPRRVTVKRGRVSHETFTFQTETAPDGREARAGALVVRFKRGSSGADQQAAHQAAGALKADKLRAPDTFRVQVGQGALARARAAYRTRSVVEYVDYDYVRRATDVPDDPHLADLYGLEKIEATSAWDTTHSAASVKVAILDCGIYSSSSTYLGPDGQAGHADLRSKVVAEAGFADTPDVDDWCDHGSHVAGTAAAATNNGLGVAGVGFNASLLNGKVLDDTGSGSDSTVADGLYWAADQGANVINMSLGGPGSCTETLQDAVDYAWSRGAVIVAAAGNAGNGSAESPGNCNHVIAVAATDSNDDRADFSNYGSNVDIAAPGVGILSTNYTGSYIELSGTSMATPHVAGLAALIWSTSFGTSNQAVVDRIEAGADPIDGTGSLWEHGRINAARSVQATQAPPLAAGYSSSPPTSWASKEQKAYSVQVTNTGSQTWSATGTNRVRLGIHFATSATGWSWATDQRFALPSDVAPGQSVTLNVTVKAPADGGDYFLKHRMVKEGVAWFDQAQSTSVTVSAQALSASYVSAPPTSWAAGQQQSYTVEVTNTGSDTWNAGGSNPVRLGIHFASSATGWNWATDQRFTVPNDVAPGQTVTLNVTVKAPADGGAYILKHRMVKEGVAWFDQAQTTSVTVN